MSLASALRLILLAALWGAFVFTPGSQDLACVHKKTITF
jgi:hypothetical protein